MNLFERSRIVLAALSLSVASAGHCMALDNREHLNDFIHYVMIAKPDLAKAHVQKLFDSGITDAELAELVDENIDVERLERAFSRGRAVGDLENVVAQLESRVEQGRLDLARNGERVLQAIDMLTGTQRQKLIGRNRLREAGEYAVPALLQEVVAGSDPARRLAAREMIVEIGRQAVTPLAESLEKLDGPAQVQVCEVLGRIGWSHAAPYLLALANTSSAAEPARAAAQRAFTQVGGSAGNVSSEYTALARRYFNNEVSLTAYPTEATNNIWTFDSFVGLVATPVSTEIYNEVMAMRMSRLALATDGGNREALALFIAANLKRENELPEGASDPIFGDSDFSPAFYALAAGPGVIQDVLAMGLDGSDTLLVRDAIAALSRTAGGANLWTASGGRRPLLDALQYPDRRVRYEAALALGKAMPAESFSGDFQVVPLLAAAVRAGASTYALVIADSNEDQTQYAARLEAMGYDVVAFASDVASASMQIAQSPGVDIVVVRQSRANAANTVASVRLNPKTAVSPVLILADATDVFDLRQSFDGDHRVGVNRAVISNEAFAASLDGLMRASSGGRIDEAEAQIYAIESLTTLNDIAINGATVYNIADAESALIASLESGSASTPIVLVANVLSRINSRASQQALLDAAFNAEGGQQLALLERVAESAKRFGNLSESRHVSRLMAIIVNGGTPAEAAARVHGAYNLPPSNVVDLIIRN